MESSIDDRFTAPKKSGGVPGTSKCPSFTSFYPVEPSNEVYFAKLKATLKKTDPADASNELNARGNRIQDEYQNRMKAAPKTLVEQTEDKKEPIERQLAESERKLKELMEFAEQIMTNMRVVAEKRELERKQSEITYANVLNRDFEKESVEALAQFNNITSKWTELDELQEPIAMFERLEKQKQKVADLMASKDELIKQCKAEMERINERCDEDRMAMENDSRCLMERIDKQYEIMKLAYIGHLELLDRAICEEREKMISTAHEKWSSFYEAMCKSEGKKHAKLKAKEEFYTKEIKRISACQEEITRQVEIRLDQARDDLLIELRERRNKDFISSEKLDYNYQVLQKRNEENVIANNQQKRRVSRLNETIAALKAKITVADAQSKVKINKLTNDIEKLHASIGEIETKAQQLRANNIRKFNEIWNNNYEEITNLLKKIDDVDRIIYEQVLMHRWTKPEIDLSNINPLPETPERSGNSRKIVKTQRKKPTTVNDEKEKRLLRNILRLVADRAGFLVEEKIFQILEPYSEQDQALVRLDNIFVALRINDMEAVSTLKEYFMPYAYCPYCCPDDVPKDALRKYYTFDRLLLGKESSSDASDSTEKPRPSTSQEAPPECKNHKLVIEPFFVLSALKEFSDSHGKVTHRPTTELPYFISPNGIPFTDQTIKDFWGKFKNYVTPEKRKLWHFVEHGLNHFVESLQRRAKLDEECEFLRRQNIELRHLLQKFKV